MRRVKIKSAKGLKGPVLEIEKAKYKEVMRRLQEKEERESNARLVEQIMDIGKQSFKELKGWMKVEEKRAASDPEIVERMKRINESLSKKKLPEFAFEVKELIDVLRKKGVALPRNAKFTLNMEQVVEIAENEAALRKAKDVVGLMKKAEEKGTVKKIRSWSDWERLIKAYGGKLPKKQEAKRAKDMRDIV